MPKIKIPKSVADRIKITGSGKVMRRKVGVRHLRMAKRKTTLRRSKVPQEVVGPLAIKLKRLLGV
jgi:ribosomal protein L35